MTFTLGHCNIAQTDRAVDEQETINAVSSRSDCCTWNEARDAHEALINLTGWFSVESSGLAISWRFAKLAKVDHGSKMVMRGGHVGADGKPGGDDRRVGPSRHVLWVVLAEKATNRRVILATHHAVARADTSNKWRRPLRAQGFAGVVTELRTVQRRYPAVPLVFTGDMNTIPWIVAFAALGVKEVRTPATYGRLRYDRVFTNAFTANVRPLTTKSDHKALLLTVALGAAVPQAPTGAPPAARPPPAPRRPVQRPWQRFSRRWRRRHPKLWHRIAVWRRRNPR